MTFIAALVLSRSACVCLLRCGAVLCDSLMWTAPCHRGSLEQAPSAMEAGPQGVAPSQSPLLRSDVEAFCDVIVNGMKVGQIIPPFITPAMPPLILQNLPSTLPKLVSGPAQQCNPLLYPKLHLYIQTCAQYTPLLPQQCNPLLYPEFHFYIQTCAQYTLLHPHLCPVHIFTSNLCPVYTSTFKPMPDTHFYIQNYVQYT